MCYGAGCPHENSWGECTIGSRSEIECPLYGPPEADEACEDDEEDESGYDYFYFDDADRPYDEMVDERIEMENDNGNGE